MFRFNSLFLLILCQKGAQNYNNIRVFPIFFRAPDPDGGIIFSHPRCIHIPDPFRIFKIIYSKY